MISTISCMTDLFHQKNQATYLYQPFAWCRILFLIHLMSPPPFFSTLEENKKHFFLSFSLGQFHLNRPLRIWNSMSEASRPKISNTETKKDLNTFFHWINGNHMCISNEPFHNFKSGEAKLKDNSFLSIYLKQDLLWVS